MKKDKVLNKLIQAEKVPSKIADMLVNISEYEEVNTKTVLIDIGESCQDIYFILEGGFVCQYLNDEGDYKSINFYLHNYQQFFTIPEAYFFNKTSEFRIKTITKTSIIRLPGERIKGLINESTDFSEWYYQRIVIALVEEIQTKSKLISFTSKKLYHHLIEISPEVIQQVPSVYISEYLGISREHLSRIRNEK